MVYLIRKKSTTLGLDANIADTSTLQPLQDMGAGPA